MVKVSTFSYPELIFIFQSPQQTVSLLVFLWEGAVTNHTAQMGATGGHKCKELVPKFYDPEQKLDVEIHCNLRVTGQPSLPKRTAAPKPGYVGSQATLDMIMTQKKNRLKEKYESHRLGRRSSEAGTDLGQSAVPHSSTPVCCWKYLPSRPWFRAVCWWLDKDQRKVYECASVKRCDSPREMYFKWSHWAGQWDSYAQKQSPAVQTKESVWDQKLCTPSERIWGRNKTQGKRRAEADMMTAGLSQGTCKDTSWQQQQGKKLEKTMGKAPPWSKWTLWRSIMVYLFLT